MNKKLGPYCLEVYELDQKKGDYRKSGTSEKVSQGRKISNVILDHDDTSALVLDVD